MNDDHIEKIKSRGYWRINFQPLVFAQNIGSINKCREIVEKNAVHLRGWDYPHVPNRNDKDTGMDLCDGYCQGWVDWRNHKEFWRMYLSGQFLHYLGLREDWLDEDSSQSSLAEEIKPMSSLNVITTVYQMTEIFLLLERLTGDGLYNESISVSISLINTQDRKLWISDFSRGDFVYPRVTGAERIEYSKRYEVTEALTNIKQLAIEAVLYFFDRFGWDNPPLDALKKDQGDFFQQRL